MSRSLIAAVAGAALLATATGAQSATLIYSASMNGANVVPPTASPATGSTLVTINDVTNTMTVQESFSGLIGGPATAAHIHCCTPVGSNAGVAVGLTGFPATASGTYFNTFDLTSTAIYSSAFLAASGGTAADAEAALLTGIADHQAYSNIHDAAFPGGEISGFLSAAVPEPTTWALMMLGVGGVGAALRLGRPSSRQAAAI